MLLPSPFWNIQSLKEIFMIQLQRGFLNPSSRRSAANICIAKMAATE